MARLTDEEINELVELGEKIQMDLSCDANNIGLPCKTDRFSAIDHMVKYLKIHGIHIQSEED